jgi:RNA polymerase sigma-70 factor, ECF subfamily
VPARLYFDVIDVAERLGDDAAGRAQDGDAVAFSLLMRPLVEPGLRLAVGMLGDRGLAEDAVQDALILAWRRIATLRDSAAVRLWFLAIVANRCRDTRRARWWSVLKQWELWPRRGDPAGEQGSSLDLHRALARLSADQRAVIVLHYYFDLPLEDVATVSGLRVGTVKSRLHRGLRQLRTDMAATEVPA